jgi:UDP:flavonoid glycosyltransferase YjiC (YdhE family)
MRILWAVSSVGKGHVIRDVAIVNQLRALSEVEVDWLAPYPADEFLRSRGHCVLECSSRLAGSGRAYEQVFSQCTEEFNLMDYIRVETKLHKPDFFVSAACWAQKSYDAIVGDEAFWLLTGFSSRWAKKPAPFIFLTDFIGTRVMRWRLKDAFTAWFNNLGFSMSHMGPDVYVYIGQADEIPDERLGLLLPRRRKWATRHCRFVRPIVGFDPQALPDRRTLRQTLGLSEAGTVFLATVGPEGNHAQRVATVERAFEYLKDDFPESHFIMVCPNPGGRSWIEYHRFLDDLYRYFAAADFVITQSGYGKVAELSALGTPFIAIPLDHHFEQESFMGHRLRHYGTGELVTARDHTPEAVATIAQRLMKGRTAKIEVDTGVEVANIILDTVRGNLT